MSTTFKCTACDKVFTTTQTKVRQWPIAKWWVMVGKQCANCRVEAQGEPRQVAAPALIKPDTHGGIAAARARVMRERHHGVVCPCCDQYARIYRRKLNRSMVLSLVEMYRAGGITKFVHTPTVLGARRGEEARLSYWGLTEESREQREDGGRRGYWRVTRRGELFLQQAVLVPERALIYNGQLLELTGKAIGVRDALGSAFDLRELMES